MGPLLPDCSYYMGIYGAGFAYPARLCLAVSHMHTSAVQIAMLLLKTLNGHDIAALARQTVDSCGVGTQATK